MFDKMKTLNELRKIQKELKKVEIEVEAGDGAVKLVINGEQKVQKVMIDGSKVDPSDITRLEKWLESAFNQAITKSQQEAAEKMKSVAGGLGLPGL
ncbi:MAG: YbaB/EbfC family nucleoid-associated protein [bacterium]|nr:YbaB/EbfC family nucleoid-associated protein [bacterium]